MPWPLSQDYNEAVQSPETSFADPELRRGEVATNALGLPMPCSGNFADVYRLNCPASKRSWAVKCFTRQIPGLQERYQQISRHLQQGKPPFMVDFTFLDRGIQIRGDWYPILKMQWVEGLTLNQFVKSNLDKPQVLDVLCQLWVKLATRLREANIAHCDLQHGNVLLVPGNKGGSAAVRLVDYDGMCVPALTLLKSMEAGHPSYQHPQRLREGTYSLAVDRFSHLVIYTALRSLMVCGRPLWDRHDDGDNLLFKPSDFAAPTKSALLYELLKSPNGEVHHLAEVMLQSLAMPLDQVPLLEQCSAKDPASAAGAGSAPARPGVAPGQPSSTRADVFAAATATTTSGPGQRHARRRANKKSLPAWIAGGVGLTVLLAGLLAFAVWPGAKSDSGPATAGLSTAPTHLQTKGTARFPSAAARSSDPGEADPSRQTGPATNPETRPDTPVPVRPETKPETRPEPPAPTTLETKPQTFTNSLGIKFALVPKGKSWLGGGGGEPGTQEVVIRHDFYLGVYEVTQQEWQKLMGSNPSHFSRMGAGKNRVKGISDAELGWFPVENVSWDDAQSFLTRLNAQEKEPGWLYRLPTASEWEYACRGGPSSKEDSAFDFYFDRPSNDLSSSEANFNGDFPAGNAPKGKFLERTTKVGSYKANPLGIHDMHGNVWEWCQDATGSGRVMRGGGWHHGGPDSRAAFRSGDARSSRYPALGFRVARVPADKEIATIAPEEKKIPPEVGGKLTKFTNSLGMQFALVPKGKSWLGGGGGKPGTQEVEISHDFYLGVYVVTQQEWQKLMGSNPSHFSRTGAGKDRVKSIAAADLKWYPVENVSWNDAQSFLKLLNARVNEPGWLYRLPTEAEWEYTCRGGPISKEDSAFDFYFDRPSNDLSSGQANFDGNFPAGNAPKGKDLQRTTKVGSYAPNRLGIYDMHGNVWQWCQDSWGSGRVIRGGCWHAHASDCRAANRGRSTPSNRRTNHGFRLARVPSGP